MKNREKKTIKRKQERKTGRRRIAVLFLCAVCILQGLLGENASFWHGENASAEAALSEAEGESKSSIPVKQAWKTTTARLEENAVYAAPEADGVGTKEDPMSLEKAIQEVLPGQTIYLLDGVYTYTDTLKIREGNDGMAEKYKTMAAYPGAEVMLDFSQESLGKRGLVLEGDYWHIYGITICGAGHDGILIAGNYNVIEYCVFDGNRNTGCRVGRSNSSYNSMEQWPSYNYILNCTSKNNADPEGEDADGFAPKLTCGEGNVFDGCMAYNNVDDGWDCYAKKATGPIGVVTMINCIAFRNGQTEDGIFTEDSDGNGFKLGGGGIGTPHIVINCLAFENKNCGFTDNNNPSALTLIHCTAFNNNLSGKKGDVKIYRCDGASVSSFLCYNEQKSSSQFQNLSGEYIVYNTKSKWYSIAGYQKVDTSESAWKGKEEKTGITAADFIQTKSPEIGTDFHKLWRGADGSIDTCGYAELSEESMWNTFSGDEQKAGASFTGKENFVTAENAGQWRQNLLLRIQGEVTPTIALTTTPTPKPTATPTPTPEPTGLAKAETIDVTGDNYPKYTPGTLTGYGQYTENTGLMLVYAGPGTSYGLMSDYSGTLIAIPQTTPLYLYHKYRAADKQVYWHVGFRYNGIMYYGYVKAMWITEIDEETANSSQGNTFGSMASFEAYLTQQGFPESYKAYLRELHVKYPNWIFQAYHTGLDWNTVIEQESVVGKNLIPNTKSVEWKSTESGAYDWSTDTFVLYDGSTWVTASEAAIAYYMDPRNFLNESNIFMFEVLKYASQYQNASGVENILKGTPFYQSYFLYENEYGNYESITYAEAFIEAAKYSGVSPYHLASRVKQEVVISSTKVSNSVTGTVSGLEGLYNFYNIGAYHSTVAGGNIANGLKYAKNGASNNDALNDASLIPWTDPYKSIVGGGYILGVNYINRGQDTIYLQKFNVTGNSTYYHQYMANVEAPYSESKKTAAAYANADMADLPIVFSIPVYLNMPDSPVSAPQKEYNPNNWLKTLKIYDINGKELTLTPTFNLKADWNYYLVVEEEDPMIQIEAKTVSSKASVSGTGFYALPYGNTDIKITVTAENGTIREYVITVIRPTE